MKRKEHRGKEDRSKETSELMKTDQNNNNKKPTVGWGKKQGPWILENPEYNEQYHKDVGSNGGSWLTGNVLS